jgi:hypothetical protein
MYARNWSLPERTRSDRITPIKSETFLPELAFREVPGKLTEGRQQTQCLRRLFLQAPLLNAVAGRILPILRTPVRLRLLPPRRLALRLTARVLAYSYSLVGTEPVAADGAWSFPGRGHSDSSSPRSGKNLVLGRWADLAIAKVESLTALIICPICLFIRYSFVKSDSCLTGTTDEG